MLTLVIRRSPFRDVAELSERICTVVCFTTLGSSSGLTFVDWRRDANDVIKALVLASVLS